MFDVKKMLAGIIGILTVIADKTETTLDNKVLSLLRALEASPFLLDWLQTLFNTDTPPGALNHINPNDPELVAAFNKSPEVQEWARRQRPVNPAVPPGSEQLSISAILALIKYIPMLIELYKAWKASQTPTT